MINKNSLHTGDLVVLRNGKEATVFKNVGASNSDLIRFHTKTNSFTYMHRYDEHMTHESKSEYDVVEVYRVKSDTDRSVYGDAILNPAKMYEYGEVIMRRNNETNTTEGTATASANSNFDLSQYKSGDMFLFANGKYGTLLKDIPNFPDTIRFHSETNSFMPVTRWNGNNHESNSGYNIIKAYRPLAGDTSKVFDAIANPEKMVTDDNLIYDREQNDADAFMTFEDFLNRMARGFF